jgi:AraC-like DNA-binding protein
VPDPLSLVLARANVEAAFFSRMRGASPWGVQTRGADCGIFHVVVQGEASLQVGGQRVDVAAGQVVVVPGGLPHVLAHPADASPAWIGALPQVDEGLPTLLAGRGEPGTEILCGTLRLGLFGRELVLPHLPPVMHARGPEVAGWVAALAGEVGRRPPGTDAVSACLGELLFLLALREWLAKPRPASFLAALVPPDLGRVVAAVQEAPAADWSLERMARRAGLSRSVFCERFLDVMGEPPGAWVTRWRMLVARERLAEPGASVARVAEAVGYESESAFNRAFRRSVGMPPARWRRAAVAGGRAG